MLVSGCDQNLVKQDIIEGYYLEGAIVKDYNLDRLSVELLVNRNDSTLTTATVAIGNETLTYGSGKYFKNFGSIDDLGAGDHYLKLYDSSLFIDSVMFTLGSYFEISSKIPPDTNPFRAGELVRLEWTNSLGAEGYAIAATPVDENYDNSGYAEMVTTGVTAMSFNPDAFALPSGELDTGWYYVYVYSYNDVPITGTNLPTLFPDDLDNSTVSGDLTVKFGSVIVTPRDSVHAVEQ